MASITKRPDGKYRARYRDEAGREHARHFDRKVDGQRWLDEQTAALVTGTHIAPKLAKTTVAQWCETWITGYGTRRASTVRQARVHIKHIVAEFGPMQLATVRPSHVRAWTAKMKAQGMAESTVYAVYRRLAQVFADAVHDNVVPRSPCSRRTSPMKGRQVPYVATTAQVWVLFEVMPARMRAAILLGAFVGLRVAEACGLRVADVDFMRGLVTPAMQYPADALKSDTSKTPVPIPQALALQLSAHVALWRAATVLTFDDGGQLGPWQLERAFRAARVKVPGLPDGFRFHDLRHYFASLLIDSGANVKVVQARLRHASAKTTLDTYGHLFPDQDEATRTAVEAVLVAREDDLRTSRSSA
jgi:integrase